MADRVHVNQSAGATSANLISTTSAGGSGSCADAHRLLNRPDSPIDDVIRLHRRVWCLLHDATGGAIERDPSMAPGGAEGDRLQNTSLVGHGPGVLSGLRPASKETVGTFSRPAGTRDRR